MNCVYVKPTPGSLSLSETSYLQKLVQFHLSVFVQIHLVENLVEGVLVNLNAQFLSKTKQQERNYEFCDLKKKHQ